MADQEQSTLLVTGGAGFIGTNFVLAQRNSGIRIINLDKLTYAGNLASLAGLQADKDHVFVQGDIGDKSLVADLLARHRPWAVVNFAAESHVDRSIQSSSAFVETNVVGTANLLDTVMDYWLNLPQDEQRAFRFLHISTDEVFGTLDPTDPAFSEETRYAPNSPYAASKAASDHFVRAYFHTHGLPALTTNCSNNYGPYQFPEKLIPLIIQNAMAGKPLPIYGDGRHVRDWLYVEDHCDAIDVVLKRGEPGQTYNIGGNSELTNIEVVTTICGILDRIFPDGPQFPHANLISHVADRPGHDRRYAIDCTKINNELGWFPSVSFSSGVETTVQWYLDNTEWISAIQSGEHQQWIETNYGER